MQDLRNRVRRAGFAGLVFAPIVLALAACETYDYATSRDLGDPDSTELRPLQFDDIPVPYGFRLVDRLNESLTYEAGAMRVGRLEYRGEGLRPEAVADFYRTQMPLTPNGWTFDHESDQGGQWTLHFSKRHNLCVVSVSRKYSTTYIIVQVDTVNES